MDMTKSTEQKLLQVVEASAKAKPTKVVRSFECIANFDRKAYSKSKLYLYRDIEFEVVKTASDSKDSTAIIAMHGKPSIDGKTVHQNAAYNRMTFTVTLHAGDTNDDKIVEAIVNRLLEYVQLTSTAKTNIKNFIAKKQWTAQ